MVEAVLVKGAGHLGAAPKAADQAKAAKAVRVDKAKIVVKAAKFTMASQLL